MVGSRGEAADIATPDLVSRAPGAGGGRVVLRGATAFLSAFLLFLVQPIVGKRILPWFGGAAPVWTACLVFFQVLVVVGYSYSHVLVRFVAARRQAVVHVGLLAASCLMLPVDPSARWKPGGGEAPLLEILGLLATSVGLPALALSTTGPLVQAWLSREDGGKAPYGLFALSNLGSLAGLLGYPLVVERAMGVRAQAVFWSVGFGVFAVMAGGLAVRAGRVAGRRDVEKEVARPGETSSLEGGSPEPAATSGPAESADEGRSRGEAGSRAAAPGAGRLVLFGVLAAGPSILLVGMTRSLSLDVAPVPLLWVVPLAAYLLSFMLVFGRPRWCSRNLSALLLLGGLGVALWLPPSSPGTVDLRVRVAAVVGALFAFSTVGHAELVRLRPDPRHLTAFYVMIAAGGAAGAILAGVVAPAALDSDLEVPLGIVLVTATFLFVHLEDAEAAGARGPRGRQGAGLAGRVLLLLALSGGLGFALLQDSLRHRRDAIALGRSFHSSLRVGDTGEGADRRRTLSHGRTVHGQQLLDPARSRWATAYYGEPSGVGLVLHRGPESSGAPARGRRLGLIGLGVGTLLAHARAGDRVTVYEIDPLVVDFARRYFSYLQDTEAAVSIVAGDARVALEREEANGFDVLVVDAFSGDAIPAHLLTREAFEVYGRHLAPDGILAVHASNRYVDLPPVAKLSGEAAGYEVTLVRSDADDDRGLFSATWVLAARRGLFDRELVKRHAEEIEVPRSLRVWTDDESSLVPVLR